MGCFIFGSGGSGGGGVLNWDQVTMEPQFGLSGKKFFDKNKQLRNGTIQNWNGEKIMLNPEEQWDNPDIVPSIIASYIPAGYYIGQDIKIASMPIGSVNVSWRDSYSYAIEKTAGYINGETEVIVLNEGYKLVDTNNFPTANIGRASAYDSGETLYLPYAIAYGNTMIKPHLFNISAVIDEIDLSLRGSYILAAFGSCESDGTPLAVGCICYISNGTVGQVEQSDIRFTVEDQPSNNRIKLTWDGFFKFASKYYVTTIACY